MRIGVSACLLGMPVRYDGGHKASAALMAIEGAGVSWMPICPEVECGLGIPREPMRLEAEPDALALRTVTTRLDHTHRLIAWCAWRLDGLERAGVAGFVFKSRSPSCGLAGVPVCDAQGHPVGEGAGLFARACGQRFPGLPLVEGDRVVDWRGWLALCAKRGR
ncbi:MAG: DUF523 domain-containing protein [Magnetococcales bacterium]|nr:DUF523 domain-containing protein [Magnetococcales bacterium]